MYLETDISIGYNPKFVRNVHEKRRAAKLEAARAEIREQRLRETMEKTKAKLDHEERQRQANAHNFFIEYNVIPLEGLTIRDIIKVIAEHHGLRYGDIVGHRRQKHIIAVRDKCIRAAADARPDLSLPSIGRIFNRDHTTIMHSLRKTKQPGQVR